MRNQCRLLAFLASLLLLVSCDKESDAPENPTSQYTATDSVSWRPFAPQDVNYFRQSLYSSAQDYPPATGTMLTEDQGLQLLEQYMSVEAPATAQAALALYNDARVKAKIPSPALRVAFASLSGTVGEDAIDYILNAKTSKGLPKVPLIYFGNMIYSPERSFAETHFISPDLEQMTIIFNLKYQWENPFLFTPFMLHEAMHHDHYSSNATVAGVNMFHIVFTPIDWMMYLRQLVRHPDLASGKTELTQRYNSNALVLYNSGKGTRIGFYETNRNAPIAPNSSENYTSWYESIIELSPPEMEPAKGNALFQKVLERAKAPGVSVPENMNFSLETLEWMDQNLAQFSEQEMLEIAKALKLDVTKP